MKNYDTLSEATNDLSERGYKHDFKLESEAITCAFMDLTLSPNDFKIDEYYRFEGVSNPDDNSVVYAISSKDGIKGVIIDAYGAYAESLSFDMLQKLKMR